MRIRLLAMDVDGTLTDGRIFAGPDGEIFKAFDVKDGYAIKHVLPTVGVVPVVITGRRSTIVEKRCAELDIAELYQGVSDKLDKLREVAAGHGLQPEEIAYIGDDVNDLSCMAYAGLSACPCDAVEAVRKAADYVCVRPGGRSAVREFIDYFLGRGE